MNSHPSHDDDHNHPVVYNKIVKANHKVSSVLLRTAKIIELTFDERQEVPHNVKTTEGDTLICHLLDPVENGDKLVSNTNEWAIVAAAPEDLFEINREQKHFEEFLHVAGLNFWPIQLTNTGARVIASHECMHMLEHFKLKFCPLTGPLIEIVVPEIKDHDCQDHGHHHEHGPDCNHNH
jgi:urease accessory protein UreE